MEIKLTSKIKKWVADLINVMVPDIELDKDYDGISWDRALKFYKGGDSPGEAASKMLEMSEAMRMNEMLRLSEDFSMKDISTRTMSDEEMVDVLKQIKARRMSKKSDTFYKGVRKMGDIDPENPDRRRYPYIHPSTAAKADPKSIRYKTGKTGGEVDIEWEDKNLEFDAILDKDKTEFDLEYLRKMITDRPKKLLYQNSKLAKTADGKADLWSINLPALTGLIVDEKTGDFKVVNTCPSAGKCKTYCYAMSKNYLVYTAPSEVRTKALNFLINDPQGFQRQVEKEVASKEKENIRKGSQLYVRFHDSGDFFADDYADMALNIAEKFPKVIFYAYTKVLKHAIRTAPNFTMNFSEDSKDAKNVNFKGSDLKYSVTVPKNIFEDHIEPKAKASGKGWKFKSEQDLRTVKEKLANKYNKKFGVTPDQVITYDEMMNSPIGERLSKDVIVLANTDGDLAAARPDIRISFLFIH